MESHRHLSWAQLCSMDAGIRNLEQVCRRHKTGKDCEHVGDVSTNQDLDRLEIWAGANRMKFSEDKCNSPHFGRNYQKHRYKMGDVWLEGKSMEKVVESQTQFDSVA